MLYFTLILPDGSSENTRRNDKFPIDNFGERWYLESDELTILPLVDGLEPERNLPCLSLITSVPRSGAISRFHSFHNAWATHIAGDLNALLPENFIAEPNVQIGSLIEIDVQASELLAESENRLISQYQAPPATASLPASFPDETEVYIVDLDAARQTVGVIEIVSPANKDRPQHRDTFIAKCLNLISQGISLIIVDIVTVRLFNFHNELMWRLESKDSQIPETEDAPLYCSAYRYTF